MAINPNIALSVRPWQSADPMEMAGRAMQLQGMQQQNDMRRQAFEQQKLAMQQQFEMRKAMQQAGGDPAKAAGILRGMGLFEQAAGIEKSQADLAKAQGETAKGQMGLLRDSLAFLGRNPSDQAITATLGGMARRGLLPAEVVDGFAADVMRLPPEQRARALAEASRTPDQLTALYAPKIERIDDGQQIQFRDVNPLTGGQQAPVQRQMTPGEQQAARDAAAGRGVTMRGQDMTASTAAARLKWEQENPSLATVDTAEGVFQVPNRGGAARQVLGPDGRPLAGKPPTEGQSNTAIFAARAAESNRILGDLAQQGELHGGAIKGAADSVPLIGQALGSVVNVTPGAKPSPAQQQVEQARRDFINAVLRKESGAVIADSEFANAERQYFPQRGDSPEVIAQKARNREVAIAGLSQAAGPALPRVQQAAGPTSLAGTVGRVSGQIGGAPNPVTPPDQRPRVSGQIGGGPGREEPRAPRRVAETDRMPMPREFPVGVVLTDQQSGRQYRNTGSAWEPIR